MLCKISPCLWLFKTYSYEHKSIADNTTLDPIAHSIKRYLQKYYKLHFPFIKSIVYCVIYLKQNQD